MTTTFTEIGRVRCGGCGREVALVREEQRDRKEVQVQRRVSRHLRRDGFCLGGFAIVEHSLERTR